METHAYLVGPYGRSLRITATRQSVRKDLRVSGCNVYVKNLGAVFSSFRETPTVCGIVLDPVLTVFFVLDGSTACRDLYLHFKSCGNISSVRIATDAKTGT